MKKWSTYSPSIDCIWIQDSGVLAASLSHCFSKFGVLNIRFSREAVTLSLNCKTVGFALFQTESYVNWSIMAWMKQLPSFGVIGWLGDSKKLISVVFATCYELLWNDNSGTRHRISAYIYYVTGHRIPARALTARRNVHSVGLRSLTECTFRRPMRAWELIQYHTKSSDVKGDFVYTKKGKFRFFERILLLRGVFELTNI